MATQNPTATDVATAHSRAAANPNLERAEGGIERVRVATENLYARGKERAIELEAKLEDKIRERPIRSVLIAAGVGAGVGLLVGVVMARR
jgi:ElaB/YqjD/DUF883 family membrane-anchored ribosome-binding protein